MRWMSHRDADGLRNPWRVVLASCFAGGVLLAIFIGWRLFWFLTGDAFIAFRYAAGSHSGYGYVWNLPPFRAVEG